MDSDSIASGTVPAFVKDSSKDLGKKKRANRLAKLKQCKLDARREQWLSQVKNKGCKGESNGGGVSLPSSSPLICEPDRSSSRTPEMGSIGEEEKEGFSIHARDSESQVSSVSRGQESRKDRTDSSSNSSRSSSSSSGSSWWCSGSVSEEEEDEDDGCVDDWEAVADALTADDKRHNPNLEPSVETEAINVASASTELANNKEGELGVSEMEHCSKVKGVEVPKGRAWRADDAFRPQCLPNLSKQYSFPMNAERHCGHGTVTWACHNIISSQPSQCPICCEDLDPTDYSFFPCLCGFRLCLFCYKRILEADGRCPGCRKRYDPQNMEMAGNGGAPQYRLTRSCSMSTRF